MSDTPEESPEAVRAKLMSLSGAERIQIGAEMAAAERARILASLPPGLSADEKRCMLYERFYGEPWPIPPKP